MSTDPGDIILDPFLGTGTTGIAAKALGRHYIGIDLDLEYVSLASKKLSSVNETKYKGFFVSNYLGKIQSIRDIDAEKVFPAQLTSTEKKLNKLNVINNSALRGLNREFATQPKILEKVGSYKIRSTKKKSGLKEK